MSQCRNWCFTYHDYPENGEEEFYSKCKAEYMIIGREICPETKRKHWQGYAEFKGGKRLTTLKKINDKIHWETRKGTQEQAYTYCMKENDYVEFGERKNNQQGKRTDLDTVKQMVLEKKPLKEIWLEASSYQAVRMAEIGIKLFEDKRNWVPEVIWCHGSTGTGKTRWCYEQAPNAWFSGKNLKWWEGYDAHEDIIIDDFRPDFCTFHELLRILDRYPYTIEVKGASRQLLAKRIFITCPMTPELIYKNRTVEDIKQLSRRISLIKHFATATVTEVGGNTSAPTSIDSEWD